jgi:hypothetical protein
VQTGRGGGGRGREKEAEGMARGCMLRPGGPSASAQLSHGKAAAIQPRKPREFKLELHISLPLALYLALRISGARSIQMQAAP